MRAARLQAQAKVNLMLHVQERDDTTGYHDLITVFRRIDLADDLVVRADTKGRSLDVAGPRVPAEGLGPTEKNLAYRAALEFSGRAGWPDGFAIELTKNIPVGGGLGGGSADAGAVLRVLNTLAPQPLSDDELWSAACALGSDVPFLTREWPQALGLERGTRLTNHSDRMLPAADVLVVVPGFSIGTADAYRWLDEDRAKSGDPFKKLKDISLDPNDAAFTSPWHLFGRLPGMANQFEPVVEQRHPELRQIRERLTEKGAAMARLAGSGSCVFGVFVDTSPSDSELGFDAEVIRTRLSSRVVQVEALE